jgi:hypothetical protein
VEIQDPSCTIRTFSARELLYGVSTTRYLQAFVIKVYEMVRWSKDASFLPLKLVRTVWSLFTLFPRYQWNDKALYAF